MQFKENVQLSKIESELNQLWRSRSQANMKASLFNLVIYSEEPRRTAYFQDISRLVMSQFPCRIIFLQIDRSSQESYLRSRLSIGEESPSTHACDLILFEVAGDSIAHIPLFILPYFLPDLPIYLLWGQDPSVKNPLLPQLEKFATRIIFDSESSESLKNFSQTMLQWIESSPLDIIDMNWARTRGWREVLVHTFDSQQRINQLSSSRSIKIVYNNRPSDLFLHPDTQAIYLQSWLASRLKWQFKGLSKKDQSLVFSYQSSLSPNPFEVVLTGQRRPDLQAEEILEFEAADQEKFLYSLTRKGETQVVLQCNTMDCCELPVNFVLPNLWSGRSFIQEIFYQKPSQCYLEALRFITQIPWS